MFGVADVITPTSTDDFDLQRFVSAQQPVYATVLAGLRAGAKRTHWMWFVFRKPRGSGTARWPNATQSDRWTDHRKPNGQHVIAPEMGAAFVETLPVSKFHGIGPATAARFNALGIQSGLDIRNQTLPFLEAHFGKAGTYFYWISRGIDERPVRANRIRKSVGAENTFFSDLTELGAMTAELQPLIDKVWRHCENTGNR